MGNMVVGIDCGVHTGFAVKVAGVLVVVSSMKIHNSMFKVLELQDEAKAKGLGFKVCVEDARLRKWFGHDEARTRSKLQGAGSVKRDAVIWQDFLREHGIVFEMIPPRANMTKTSAAFFKSLTGWQGVTNEHGRDAAMMVWNKRG